MRYLRQLKQYSGAVRPRPCDAEYLIEKSLSGPPSVWWLIVKDDVTDLNSFVTKFEQCYWNEHTHHEIRNKLEFGCFQLAKRQVSSRVRVSHVCKCELTPALESKEIIRELARHYRDEFKYTIVGRGIDRSEQLIELLKEFDKIGSTNSDTDNCEWRNKNNFSRDNNT